MSTCGRARESLTAVSKVLRVSTCKGNSILKCYISILKTIRVYYIQSHYIEYTHCLFEYTNCEITHFADSHLFLFIRIICVDAFTERLKLVGNVLQISLMVGILWPWLRPKHHGEPRKISNPWWQVETHE